MKKFLLLLVLSCSFIDQAYAGSAMILGKVLDVNGKGVAGDCEFGGCRGQSAGLTNRKRPRGVQRGKAAIIVKARILHESHRLPW